MSFLADTLLKDPGWPASGATFDGAGGIDQARCIVYSGSDAAVVVTGESWRGASRGFDIATLKLRQTDAIPVWSGLNTGVRFFPTTSTSGDDRPSDMVIDKCGNVYIGGRTLNGASLDFLGLSYKPDDGDLRWLDIDTGNQYITHDGGVDGKDIGAAIRVTVEGGSLVAHDGDVFLFGEVSTGGASSSYGVARFDQLDPCNGDPSCCN